MNVVLPSVSGSFGETPELTFPADVEAPKGLRVEVLEQGNGPVVMAGQEIEVNYHGQIWNGDIFDSSYFRGEPTRFPIGVGMVIQGWDQAIVGKQVGSRLLISVPPVKGYGKNGNPRAGISGTDVLVFVVDILGAR
ncbi:peptidylprolyl isomerase [Arcanobacterium pluranimalium]|uniref:FKBP-type peptidyl-prolyl cis-trans isomerase n=1 Tax=Arcanobacterium pluranimalium TaxID=108028 RepID=UPI00195DE5D7|nr:FKBP-type peptidyl-prolyl cis-trans isomerase [Arcanobacterium pluranimalium]MBM7824812.1 peptidylprolyl isomerase [Arcanobacterium pluranimalium]